MFRIPSYLKMDSIDTDWAMNLIKSRTKSGSVLDGLENMNNMWEEHIFNEDDDDEFFDNWQYEVNAFNHCFQKFAPLFA